MHITETAGKLLHFMTGSSYDVFIGWITVNHGMSSSGTRSVMIVERPTCPPYRLLHLVKNHLSILRFLPIVISISHGTASLSPQETPSSQSSGSSSPPSWVPGAASESEDEAHGYNGDKPYVGVRQVSLERCEKADKMRVVPDMDVGVHVPQFGRAQPLDPA